MAGPNARITDRIAVLVIPDTSKFLPSLQKYVKRIQNSVKIEIPIEIESSRFKREVEALSKTAGRVNLPVDGDTSPIERDVERISNMRPRLQVDTDVVEKRISALTDTIAGLGGALARVGKAGALSAIGIAAANAIPAVVGLGVGLGQAAVSLAGFAAALPAVGALGAAAFGPLILGLQGIDEHLKPAMNNFTKLGQIAQTSLHSLGTPINNLVASLMPQLSAGTKFVADGWVRVGQEAIKGIAAMAQTGVLTQTMATVGAILRDASGAMQPFIQGIGYLVQAGLPAFRGLGESATTAAINFEAWAQKVRDTGQALTWIENAKRTLSELGSIVSSITGIFGGLFRAMGSPVTPLSAIAAGLRNVDAAVNSPAFQGALKSFFDGVKVGADGLAIALPSVKGAFIALLPVLGNVASVLGPILGEAIKYIADKIIEFAPKLDELVNKFKSFQSSIGGADVAGKLAVIAGGIGLVTAKLAPFGAGIAGVVGKMGGFGAAARFMLGPIGLIAAAFGTAVVTSKPLRDSLSSLGNTISSTLGPPLKQIAEAVMPVFQAAVDGLKESLPGLVGAFEGLVVALSPVFAGLAQVASFLGPILVPIVKFFVTTFIGAVQGFIEGLTKIVNGIVGIFGGIVNVIKGIFNVIVGIFTLDGDRIKEGFSQIWEGLKGIVSGVWEVIKGLIQAAWNFITITVIGRGIAAVKGLFTAGWTAIKTGVSAAWTAIKGFFTKGINGAKSVVTGGWNAIKSATSKVWNGIKSTLSTVWNGIKTAVTTAVNAVKSKVSAVWNGIKSVTTTVWNAVKSKVTSIWNGIKSAVTTAVNAVKNTVTNVWNTVKSKTSSIWNGIKSTLSNAWNSIKNTVKNAINNVKNTVTNGFNNVKNSVSNAGTRIKTTITNAWNSAKNAVRNGITNVVNQAKGLPGKVKSAIGNLGNLLVGAGQSMLEGLGRGIRKGISAATDAAKDAVGKVRDLFPFSPAKTGPFSGKGYTTYSGRALIKDMAKGIQSEESTLKKAVTGVLATTKKAVDANALAASMRVDSTVSRTGLEAQLGAANAANAAGAGGTTIQVLVNVDELEKVKKVSDFLLLIDDRATARGYGRSGMVGA